MLKSFHVKMLVLSAIPELVSTWVSGFGFKPIEEYEMKQLDTINLMLFPGTSLLIKSLEDGTLTEKSGLCFNLLTILDFPISSAQVDPCMQSVCHSMPTGYIDVFGSMQEREMTHMMFWAYQMIIASLMGMIMSILKKLAQIS